MLKKELLDMMRLFREIDVYLLLPMSIFTGFELTLIWNEYNRVNYGQNKTKFKLIIIILIGICNMLNKY
jgi:hypothetical protein